MICYLEKNIFAILTDRDTKMGKIKEVWEKPQVRVMNLDSTEGGSNLNYYERVGKTSYYGGS